jgi:hypothetical protein
MDSTLGVGTRHSAYQLWKIAYRETKIEKSISTGRKIEALNDKSASGEQRTEN